MSEYRALSVAEIDIPPFASDSPDQPLVTMRFCTDTDLDSIFGYGIPSITRVQITPAGVSLGEDLGQRATLTVTLSDHKHIFAGEPFDSGTFWGKFRARYGLKLRGKAMRLRYGLLPQALADMETRHFFIESTDGPNADGEFKIIGKDVLKLADGDRAQAPILSNGFLLTDITAGATTATLSPTGIGDAEYPVSGVVSLGGNEVATFGRDPFTTFLLHADGANGSSSFPDSSPVPHVVTVINGVTVSTAQKQFGTGSARIDGSGGAGRGLALDGSADFAFGTGDFTYELWFRANALSGAAVAVLMDFRPDAGGGAQSSLYINTAGQLRYSSTGLDRISGTTVLVVNTWYHIAVSRVGGNTRLFLNGVQEGGTFGDGTNYTVGASRPVIGIRGDLAAGVSPDGWIDEVRIRKGVGHYSANFTPPAAPFTLIGSGDVLTLVRGQLNTVAQSHSQQDRVQVLLQYLGLNVADIIRDLFVTYAGIPSSYIDLTAWRNETTSFLGVNYTATIGEPTSVNKLVSELVEQAGLAIWGDDVNQQIRLQVLREIPTTAQVFDEGNILADTFDVNEQPEKRISRIMTYFGKINPLLKEDEIANYRSVAMTADTAAESPVTGYGSQAIKKIFSRWIPSGGRTTALRLNDIQLGRFRDPPRLVKFSLFRYSGESAPALGGGYQIGATGFQNQSGAPVLVPVQITRLNPKGELFECEAEEMLWTQYGGVSPTVDVIIFDGDEDDINLLERHDFLYPPAVSGDTVRVYINAGVVIGCSLTNPTGRAFDVGGPWAAGVTIEIFVLGRIAGKGGRGGDGGVTTFSPSTPPTAGAVGGTAFYTRRAVLLTTTGGALWAGGGGGGGAGSSTDGASFGFGGGGGGGGGGRQGGPGGAAGFGTTATPPGGSSGTDTAGGAGGFLATGPGGAVHIVEGGTGGAPGFAGAAGQGSGSQGGAAGGAAGIAIDGISFCTVSGAPGDIRGSQVN